MSNETKQTAVEWYANRLCDIEIAYNQGLIDTEVYIESKTHAYDQAKEMEKEQHEKTYLHGFMDDDYVSFDNYWKHEYEGEKGHHKGIFGYLTNGGNK